MKKVIRFVICIDEIDTTLKALSLEDGHAVLHLLSRLLTDPSLPVRLLLTAIDKEVLERYRGGTDFLENLQTWKISLCISVDEVRELIERFEVSVKFHEDALNRIFYYSGGQIYFVKLAVKLALSIYRDQMTGKMLVNGQMIDRLMHEVIEPTAVTPFEIRNISADILPMMSNIFSGYFSQKELQLLHLLTGADKTLKASSLEVSEVQIANRLYQRGYISKDVTEEGEAYSWRIGIWQLFLENFYQLKYRKVRKEQ